MQKIIFGSFIFLIIFSIAYYIIIPTIMYNKEEIELNKLQEFNNVVIVDSDVNNTDNIAVEVEKGNENKSHTNNYSKLKKINSDMIGWIKINGTNIDYPVMFRENDYDYYLNHSFYNKYSLSGVPFASENYNASSNNILIYAHNIKGKTMFAELLNYNNKSFYLNHKYLTYSDTVNEYKYEVIAVFNSQVYYNDEKVFKYYKLDYNLDEIEFLYYITNIKKLSIYDTGVSATYGDKLITLSTCNNIEEDGRFVLVAKLVN